MYSKIQVIKMIREMVPGMGLKEAKDLVDEYELKTFENRVTSYMGKDALGELRSYARMFVSNENRKVNVPDSIPTRSVVREIDPELERILDEAEEDEYVPYDPNYCCSDCDGH